jgi:hypothetical protein
MSSANVAKLTAQLAIGVTIRVMALGRLRTLAHPQI